MLLAPIIGAAAVVAFICSFAMFLQYMREDADDDGNSKRPAGVNRVRSIAEGQAWGPAQAQEGPAMTVLIYVNTSKQVGDPDHLKVFATPRKHGSRKMTPKASLSSMRSWSESHRAPNDPCHAVDRGLGDPVEFASIICHPEGLFLT
jgi:hypothetical protein